MITILIDAQGEPKTLARKILKKLNSAIRTYKRVYSQLVGPV